MCKKQFTVAKPKYIRKGWLLRRIIVQAIVFGAIIILGAPQWMIVVAVVLFLLEANL